MSENQGTPHFNKISRIGFDNGFNRAKTQENYQQHDYNVFNNYTMCDKRKQYANNMGNDVTLNYRVYGPDGCYVPTEDYVRMYYNTNPRIKKQLFANPYLTTPFVGRYVKFDERSKVPMISNIESRLKISETIRDKKPCQPQFDVKYTDIDGLPFARYETLHSFVNPQIVQRIIYPWTRAGDDTRDFVKSVSYEKNIMNQLNYDIITGNERKFIGKRRNNVRVPNYWC